MKSDMRQIAFNKSVLEFAKNQLLFNLKRVRFMPFIIKNMSIQYKASKIRKKNKENGLQVPAVLALTITDKCNLNCTGCYLKAQNRPKNKDFTSEELKGIIGEFRDLGSSIVLLLGGEPLMRDIFSLTEDFKNDMLFALFTNSTLINDSTIAKFKKNRNIIPFLSMEGSETDVRRGDGVLQKIQNVSDKLYKSKIQFGISITVTRTNFDEVTSDTFVRKMINKGVAYFAYFEYIPIDKSTMDLTITPEQKKEYDKFAFAFKDKYKTFIFTQTIEKRFGGCLGAGTGIIHVNYDGSVETCPFAPISDMSIKNNSVKDILQSELFTNLRKHRGAMLADGLEMCSLWKSEEWTNAVETNDFSFIEN